MYVFLVYVCLLALSGHSFPHCRHYSLHLGISLFFNRVDISVLVDQSEPKVESGFGFAHHYCQYIGLRGFAPFAHVISNSNRGKYWELLLVTLVFVNSTDMTTLPRKNLVLLSKAITRGLTDHSVLMDMYHLHPCM